MKPLTEKEIDRNLLRTSLWEINKKRTEIKKLFPTKSFVSGLAFIAKITVHAELLNHHPTIELSYGSVKVTLSTHDVKGLTKLDFELAKRIDALLF